MNYANTFMRPHIVILGSLVIAGFSLAAVWQAGASAATNTHKDDGTYFETQVASSQECAKLCEANKDTCRGAISEQPDITKPLIICRLNNGFGANPLFPSTPPKALNVAIAVADLNTYRQANGLKPVVYNQKLAEASRVHAEDLAAHDTISHTGSDGSHHGDRVQRQGYYFSIAAENVATGQKSWARVLSSWQKSPGHNENLLRPDVTDFGIAMVYDPKTSHQTYWAMVVAAPLPDAPQIKYQDAEPVQTSQTH